MPPKKEAKEKQVKGDEAEEMILNYMRDINRPFASADVVANLKNRVPKTLAVKILATLAEKGQLTVKTYGKQLLYLYNQSLLSVLDRSELTSLDENIRAVQKDLEEVRKVLRQQQSELSTKASIPKTSELGKEIERVQSEVQSANQALEPFLDTSGGKPAITPMSAEEIKKIDQDFAKWRKEWVDRRKVYKNFLDFLAENGQVSHVPVFEEELGIIDDDEAAKKLEQSEMCRPAVVSKSLPRKSGPSKGKTELKRSGSDMPAGEGQKKVRKDKA
ncbi:hypothetical protein L202_06009 [Cryptococcus amylolentus CBS 6039]|uniref:Homologous-pairing protein 2 winged helix domain-containing protein n=2 Tax=Cryptococcus amylolentus CBS 6039 TaxID=1295533 RepID=A0A1E3HI86_9TREE|nr:hypothetical protein L202_06009 [Cryptococcus amylolentus CBS 6039]ODN76067.1 hypothetical protein L202_06009 [Cryptococcus amylolentus CBS 6039]